MKYEWIRATLKSKQFYSVGVKEMDTDDDGVHHEIERDVHFQVVELAHGSHRAKLVPTSVVDDEDTARSASLAVAVQYMSTWRARPGNVFTCFFDSCPVFKNVLDLAPWPVMRRGMQQWKAEVSDTEGCLDLSSPCRAEPQQVALTDPTCPALMLLDHMHALEWRALNRQIVHDNLDNIFDCRNVGPARRVYFQTLLGLADYLAANPRISSDQPQSYYKLIKLKNPS